MTTTHTPTRRSSTGPSRSASDVARAIGAAFTLAVFVVGVPAALLIVAPLSWPESWPTWDAARTALTRPDDGTLLIGAVQLVAWGAWASFTFSVVTELVATIRHAEVPSIPLLGWTQHAAATLLTTAGLLVTTSAPGLTIATQPFAFVASAPGHAHTDLTAAPAMTTPEVTMTTPGVTMTDAMTGTLRAMTPARIPMTPPTASPRTATDADHHPVISVTRGDTLWGLAERHLGSGLRYAEIRDLNLGRPQPDGRTLTDTHWIYPGWQLRLPLDATALPELISAPAEQAATAASAPVAPTETAAIPEHAPAQMARPEPLASSEPAPIGPGNAVPPAHTSATTAAPMAVAVANSRTDDASAGDDEPGFPVTQLFLGLTGLAAAGIVGELARRRHLQHRTRRTGERIPLPAPGSPSDDAERTLRAASTPLSIAELKAALLNLATRCFTAERDLPRIGTILLSEHTLELHLVDDDTDPVEPFASVGPRTWSATTADVADDEPLADDPDRPEPYPALVTLGHTDDATVIVNLEAAGTLAVDGDSEAARDVLRALVVELATSDLTGRVGLITGPEFAGLAGVSDTARLQCTDPSTLAAQHAERQRAVVDILGGAGVEDTLQARSDRTAEDTWLPVIYLDDAAEAETPLHPVAPWSGSVVLTTAAVPGAWTLTVPSAGVATLEPISRRLFPTRLAQEDLDRITDVLATATPAPATYDHLDVTTRPVADEITEALAALPAPPAPQEPSARANDRTSHGLRINVLGPIEIDGLPRSDIPLSKRSTELLVYLALRGKATGPELDEALWHGQRVDNQTRNSLVYRTRQRVGADNIPLVDADGHYRLGPDVTCDWRTFQALARAGLAAGVDKIDDLWAALGVVRNRPFLGIDDAAYTWAERDIQQMISGIVDTSHILSRVLLDANDHRGAAEAAVIGIGVEQCSELLYGDVMAAARAQGDLGEVGRLSARLNAVLEQLDPDYATA